MCHNNHHYNYSLHMYMYIQSSDYDEYTDSEDELGPRLKPVFVRK